MTKALVNQRERWSDDAFLNELRRMGDPLADECLARVEHQWKQELESLGRRLSEQELNDALTACWKESFKRPENNSDQVPDYFSFQKPKDNKKQVPDYFQDLYERPFTYPEAYKRFFALTEKLPNPDGTPDEAARTERDQRIEGGQKVFMTHALPSAMVLLAKALPEGYAAPNLSKVLRLSDKLKDDTYRRLLGVLQMVINVSEKGGFDPTGKGKAIITVPKIRLIHAGVRRIVRTHFPAYEAQYGVPVNLEDMLGTVMGFSYLVIVGLQRLNIGLTAQEAEDFYYLWRVFSQMMGIHPKDKPDSSEYIPANLEEAKAFYDSYRRRHYVEAQHNPDGVELARANLQMLNDLLPQTPLRLLGLKIVPRIYMEQLIGKDGCSRIGVKPVRFLFLTKWALLHVPWLWTRLWHAVDRFDANKKLHQNLSRKFFTSLIKEETGGEITWDIPRTLKKPRDMVERRQR